jgi:hypothetical protein
VITARAADFEEYSRLLTEAATGPPDPLDSPTASAQESPAQAEVAGASSEDADAVYTHRLKDLPKELGVLLASVGVLGVILPGIAGTPALIAGGLVLWPKTFSKVEDWFENRFPEAHRNSMQQVGRFLDDLERRYPTGVGSPN